MSFGHQQGKGQKRLRSIPYGKSHLSNNLRQAANVDQDPKDASTELLAAQWASNRQQKSGSSDKLGETTMGNGRAGSSRSYEFQDSFVNATELPWHRFRYAKNSGTSTFSHVLVMHFEAQARIECCVRNVKHPSRSLLNGKARYHYIDISMAKQVTPLQSQRTTRVPEHESL